MEAEWAVSFAPGLLTPWPGIWEDQRFIRECVLLMFFSTGGSARHAEGPSVSLPVPHKHSAALRRQNSPESITGAEALMNNNTDLLAGFSNLWKLTLKLTRALCINYSDFSLIMMIIFLVRRADEETRSRAGSLNTVFSIQIGFTSLC